jgi:hypothetical protein
MNMRIPFEIASKGMKNADKAGSKGYGFINFMEHTKNGTANGRKKTIQKKAVKKKELPELLRDGKNTMSMSTMKKFRGHGERSADRIHVTTGSAEPAMASKRNELEIATGSAEIHGTTKRRVAAGQRLINFSVPGIHSI